MASRRRIVHVAGAGFEALAFRRGGRRIDVPVPIARFDVAARA